MARETSLSPPAVKASTSGSRTVSALHRAAQTLTFEVSFGKSLADAVSHKVTRSREPPVKLSDQCVSLNSVMNRQRVFEHNTKVLSAH